MSDATEELSLQKTEREKKRQAAASQELHRAYSLPKNISDMKSYAWGQFTWRDVIVSGACELIPCLIMLSFQALMPTYVCLLIGFAIGIPFVFIANKHIFTGDLPIEQQIQIYLKNAGQSNLLSWDKTKLNGAYVPTSTQSFVPDVHITKDDFAIVNGNHGGFALDQIDVDDSTMAKPTEQLTLYDGFCEMLNRSITDQMEIPTQIYMQAVLTPLQHWMSNTVDDINALNGTGKDVMRARALDYLGLLSAFDNQDRYSYRYYMVTTYRDDSEGVGDKSMNTTSVRREQLKENANPFKKKMEAAQSVDYQIGDDRKKKTSEYMHASEFGELRTNAELSNRRERVENAINGMGSTHTNVSARRMTSADISRLFYEFFNATDKYASVPVLQQALEPKVALYSPDVYKDFSDVFHDSSERHDIYGELIGKNAVKSGRQRLSQNGGRNASGTGHGNANAQLNIPASFIQSDDDDDDESDMGR
jgi:hypothetical protein